MEIIGQSSIYSYFDESPEPQEVSNQKLRLGKGHRVSSFLELVKKVAELQFLNRDHMLLFRGQSDDYRDADALLSLKPSIFRLKKASTDPNQYSERYEQLKEKEIRLLDECRTIQGHDRLTRYQVLRWAILQHYEMCATPLLDVTQSLRIAASFASIGNNKQAFLFVLGVPNLGGAITGSAEAGLQIIRLNSVCPPSALRPHIQEGYLLGEYPELSGYERKRHLRHFEVDFGRRLIAVFRFDPNEFWSNPEFPRITKTALYPSKTDDPIYCLLSKHLS